MHARQVSSMFFGVLLFLGFVLYSTRLDVFSLGKKKGCDNNNNNNNNILNIILNYYLLLLLFLIIIVILSSFEIMIGLCAQFCES